MRKKNIMISDTADYRNMDGMYRKGRRIILTALLAAGIFAAGVGGTTVSETEAETAAESVSETEAATAAESVSETETFLSADSSAETEAEAADRGDTLSPDQSVGPITAADALEEFEQGRKVQRGDIKVVDLRGTWREMGRQYGHLMKAELEEVWLFLDIITQAKEGNTLKARYIVDQQIEQTPYRISEFFEGASETSGMTVDQLQFVNAVERIGGLPKCSVAMAWDEYAASDLVIGRNYDYAEFFSLLKDAISVTVYHPADGALATATIGYVGEIYAVNGINEKGIFLELNNGKFAANIKSPDKRVTGTTMLFECLFEADELNDTELFFNTVNCSSSYIINVADEKEGRSFEWCPVGVKHGGEDLPEGLLVSTNYYLNPDWLFAVPSDEACWFGQTRRRNLVERCEEQKGDLDEEKMMEIIDKTLDEGGAKNELTVYQMVVVPKTKMLWLQITGGSSWTQIDLESFLNS